MNQIYKPLLFVIILCGFSCSYLPENQETASDLTIQETADYIELTTSNVDLSKAGIVFYPGGLVDPHAYITAFKDFVLEDRRTVIILKVESNLAIFNTQKASSVIEELSDVSRWVVGGHSLGGIAASKDVFKNPDVFHGLFFLASYTVDDLSSSDIPIISVVGSRDGVIDFQEYSFGRDRVPTNVMVETPFDILEFGTSGTAIYYEIEGGNHAKFGNYGKQKGDNDGTIDSESQQALSYQMIRKFLEVNGL